MSGESGQGGTNMAKLILGIVLMVAGDLIAIKAYPQIHEVVMPAKSAPGALVPGQPIADMSKINGQVSNYFFLLMVSLLLINAGGVFLYQSRES